MEQINIRPDAGYDTMSEVTVNIPVEDVEQTIENNGEYNINAGNSFMKSVRLNVNVAGGAGGDVELKTFGGKSLKGQGEFLDSYSGIPAQGDVLGVTGQTYSPERIELNVNIAEEYQNAYSYKFIEFYNSNAYNLPTPNMFVLYVKKTQEDLGTLLLYENYDSLNLRTSFVCTEDFTDMKTYQMNSLMYFYNSNSVFQLTETELSKIDLDTKDETFKNFIQWLRTHNFNKQILTQNRTTIISDDSGNLYKIQENDYSIPQPVSFTHYSSELRCNTDNMYYMYDNNMGIIYKRDENNNILYCSDDRVEEFKLLDSYVGMDDTPKIYQYFELQFEGYSSYGNYLVSPNSGECYYIEKTSSEEGVETVSLKSIYSSRALSGIDLSSYVWGYMNEYNGVIICNNLGLVKFYNEDRLSDYSLGFVTPNPGIDELQVQNIAEEKINEFKNSGYIENVATAKATKKVDSELYNISHNITSYNVKDYAESDLNDESLSVVNAPIPYSGSNTISLNADFTNAVPQLQTDYVHHAVYRIMYNGNRIFEIGVHRKEDGDIAPTVKCLDGAAEYFEPGSLININDGSGNSFDISDFVNQTYKVDEYGFTGKHIYINYQINSNISLTQLDFQISTYAMRNWTGGVNNSNLTINAETTTKTAKYATVNSVKPYMGSMPDSLPSEAGDWVLVYNKESGFRFELKS